MIDKQWLEKIQVAYKVYPYPNMEVERFLSWLYKQYGIEQPTSKTD